MSTTVLLFYKYVAIPEKQLESICNWLREECVKLELVGRIILANEGINSNLAGTPENIKSFMNSIVTNEKFEGIDFKLDTIPDKLPCEMFPDLKIKVQKEICATANTMQFNLLEQGLGGKHLAPEEFHKVLDQYWGKGSEPSPENSSKELVVIDVRNRKEYDLGRFEASDNENLRAIDPDTKMFSEWSTSFANKKAEELKDKKVLMYCTGGIRCEKASAYLRSLGVDDVSQLSGGIHRYLEKYQADGYFKGKNFVFDARGLQDPTNMGKVGNPASESKAKVLGKCNVCAKPDETLSPDRACAVCRDSVIVCDECRVKRRGVYYCRDHHMYEGIYFPFLGETTSVHTKQELERQKAGLEKLLLTVFSGPKSKSRRQAVHKQLNRITRHLQDIDQNPPAPNKYFICSHNKLVKKQLADASQADNVVSRETVVPKCRSCGDYGPRELLDLISQKSGGNDDVDKCPCDSNIPPVEVCNSRCWGFFGYGKGYANVHSADDQGKQAADKTRTSESGNSDSTTRSSEELKRKLEKQEEVDKSEVKKSKVQHTKDNSSVATRQETNGDKGMASNVMEVERDDDQKPKKRRKEKKEKKKRNKKPREVKLYDETDYWIDESGPVKLRRVIPYMHTFTTFAKQRWLNREILSIFADEFGSNTPEYYRKALETGLMKVNGEAVGPSYVIRNSDHIEHLIHRHEPAVAYCAVEDMVVQEEEDYLLINKPATLPVHPTGAFCYNSLTVLLARYWPSCKPGTVTLHPVHRLDRLTSGLVIVAKSSSASVRLGNAMNHKGKDKDGIQLSSKGYIAQVKGRFPATQDEYDSNKDRSQVLKDVLANHPICRGTAYVDPTKYVHKNQITDVAKPGIMWKAKDAVDLSKIPTTCKLSSDAVEALELSCPIRCASRKVGAWECSLDGDAHNSDRAAEKPSLSRFLLLSYDEKSNTSIVHCEPLTGRTHQLRLHLQLLGFPISNDPNYNTLPEFYKDIEKDECSTATANPTAEEKLVVIPPHLVKVPTTDAEKVVLETCDYCSNGEHVCFSSNQLRHTGIYLHAYRYKAKDLYDWSVPFPQWAL